MHSSDWNDYQAFLAIARGRQLARAAATLGVDATTIGRRLRRLEARIGATLFEQTREGQVPTEAGEALLPLAEAMAAAAARIDESTAPHTGLGGLLRVSVPEGFGGFLATRLGEFAALHPGLVIDLVASTGLLSPSKREADLAVTLSRPRGGRVIAGKLSDYALRLYAAHDYLARRGAPEAPADLAAGHRLVGYIPDLVYAPELRYLDEIHPGLAATVRSSSIAAQARVITAGGGIGVLPAFIGDADPALAPVFPERRIVRSFWLVTHKDTHALARVRAFKDWLTALVQHERERLLPG